MLASGARAARARRRRSATRHVLARHCRGECAAVQRLTRTGAKALVLDLRGNPGGLLEQAVGVVSLFLPQGSSVVSLAGAHKPLRIIYSRGGAESTIPLAVLVDGGSASASEVVAGALKDHGRGRVVGEPTYGKSLVQEIVRLPSGAALKLTVARYLTPAASTSRAAACSLTYARRTPLTQQSDSSRLVVEVSRRGRLIVGDPYFTPGVPLVLESKGIGDVAPGDLAVVRTGRGRAKVDELLGPADQIENVLEALLVERGARQPFEPHELREPTIPTAPTSATC